MTIGSRPVAIAGVGRMSCTRDNDERSADQAASQPRALAAARCDGVSGLGLRLSSPPLRAISPPDRGLGADAGQQDVLRSARGGVASDPSCTAGPAALSVLLEQFPGLSPGRALKESRRLAILRAPHAPGAASERRVGRRTKADHRALLGRLREGTIDSKLRRGELTRAEELARVEQRMVAADSAASPVALRDRVSERSGEGAWRGQNCPTCGAEYLHAGSRSHHFPAHGRPRLPAKSLLGRPVEGWRTPTGVLLDQETYLRTPLGGQSICLEPARALVYANGIYVQPPPRSARLMIGTRRDRVRGWSAGAARRARRLIQQLNTRKVGPLRMATLTYPAEYPEEGAQVDVGRWRDELRRRIPGVCGFWVVELQERGAPHFHVVLGIKKGFPQVSRGALEKVGREVWTRRVTRAGYGGSPAGAHAVYGFDVTDDRPSARELCSYVTKYATKDVGKTAYRGRLWAHFGGLPTYPLAWCEMTAVERTALNRTVARWLASRGTLGARRFAARYARNGGGFVGMPLAVANELFRKAMDSDWAKTAATKPSLGAPQVIFEQLELPLGDSVVSYLTSAYRAAA